MEKITSRKFWMALVSALLVLLNDGFDMNIPSDTILQFVGVIIAYILGQSYVDGRKNS